MCGIITSRMTASGRALATRSRAARPSPAETTAVALLHERAVERVDHRRLVIDYQDFHSQSIDRHPKTDVNSLQAREFTVSS